jgi:hypothetical protein
MDRVTVAGLWLGTMAAMLIIGAVVTERWMIEAGIAGMVGFGVGWMYAKS